MTILKRDVYLVNYLLNFIKLHYIYRVTHFRFADDNTLIAGTKYDLTELITKVKRASEEDGLYLKLKKTKAMTKGELDYIIVDDNNIEIVDTFIFRGVLITNNGITDISV